MPRNDSKEIGIIGGGIAGLAAAWKLQKLLPDARISVFEASDRLGGFLQTEVEHGYRIDQSADMFTTAPSTALDVCRELGREHELIATRPVKQRAFVATDDGIAPVPNGFSLMLPNDVDAVMESDLLDAEGKARFLAEEYVPVRSAETDECLASFAVRRFGKQAFDHLIQPLVSGIYTADPEKLSMQATLSRFVSMERKHGSLIAAARFQSSPQEQAINKIAFADQAASGARYDLFRAPQNGMGQLVEWIVQDLGDVQVFKQSGVTQVHQVDERWNVEFRSGASPRSFDALIVATGAGEGSRLLSEVNDDLASELASIEAASCAIVVLGFDAKQFETEFRGYGIVIPACLRRKMIAASFSSNKFAGRAPDGKVLVRCFVGGALQSELVDLSDEELQAISVHELDRMLGIRGKPEMGRVIRWRNSMPQYHIGHQDRIRKIEQWVGGQPGLELAGNSYNGVGIPVCLDSGIRAAKNIVSQLTLGATT